MGNHQLLSCGHQLKKNWCEDSMKTWGKYNKTIHVFFHTVGKTVSSFLAIPAVFSTGESLVFTSPPSFFGGVGEIIVNNRAYSASMALSPSSSIFS